MVTISDALIERLQIKEIISRLVNSDDMTKYALS